MSGKKAKLAPGAMMTRLGALRDSIKSLFKVIRTARIVLRHVEACLVELYAVSEDQIDRAAAPTLPQLQPQVDPNGTHPDP